MTYARERKLTPIVVVRSRSKLETILDERSVPKETITAQLTIIEGNIKNPAAVKSTIQRSSSSALAVDMIISGVGGAPTFSPNPLKPGLDDPTICQDGMRTILNCLREIKSERKPLVVALSTTGMSDAGRDIPVLMIPLYYWLLAVPHQDKKTMEEMLLAEVGRKKAEEGAIRGFVVVRASLLTNGERIGADKVRVGIETPKTNADDNEGELVPAIGYTISTNDVGSWVYEKLVQESTNAGTKYLNKYVTITY